MKNKQIFPQKSEHVLQRIQKFIQDVLKEDRKILIHFLEMKGGKNNTKAQT